MKVLSIFTWLVFISLSLVFFQNCGEEFRPPSYSESLKSAESGPNIPTPEVPQNSCEELSNMENLYIGRDAERLVVAGESIMTRSRGRYIFPKGSPSGSTISFKVSLGADRAGMLNGAVTSTSSAPVELFISKCPGGPELASNCISSFRGDVGVLRVTTRNDVARFYCKLETNQEYYYNYRIKQGATCNDNKCDFYMTSIPDFIHPLEN